MIKQIQDLIEENFYITLSKCGSTFFCSVDKQIAVDEFLKDETESKNNLEEAIDKMWKRYFII